jgi:hypothetical protein
VKRLVEAFLFVFLLGSDLRPPKRGPLAVTFFVDFFFFFRLVVEVPWLRLLLELLLGAPLPPPDLAPPLPVEALLTVEGRLSLSRPTLTGIAFKVGTGTSFRMTGCSGGCSIAGSTGGTTVVFFRGAIESPFNFSGPGSCERN